MPSGKIRYPVGDRPKVPDEGDLAVVCSDNGLKVREMRRPVSTKNIWGRIVWVLQEG
jgi:hypothetical protein